MINTNNIMFHNRKIHFIQKTNFKLFLHFYTVMNYKKFMDTSIHHNQGSSKLNNIEVGNSFEICLR